MVQSACCEANVRVRVGRKQRRSRPCRMTVVQPYVDESIPALTTKSGLAWLSHLRTLMLASARSGSLCIKLPCGQSNRLAIAGG
jgi:hypothetical protein